LLVPHRHVVDWFEASPTEQAALTAAIGHACEAIEAQASRQRLPKPDGYNVGFNAGAATGQTVFHLYPKCDPALR
jgi:diadenosine tetraphosphate (Ap4A) HIT family hydrolase